MNLSEVEIMAGPNSEETQTGNVEPTTSVETQSVSPQPSPDTTVLAPDTSKLEPQQSSPDTGALVTSSPQPEPTPTIPPEAPTTIPTPTPSSPQPMDSNFYARLGVSPQATQQEITKAFRQYAVVNHPDKFNTASEEIKSDVTEKFKRVNEAYETLRDPEKRSAYDAKLAQTAKVEPEKTKESQVDPTKPKVETTDQVNFTPTKPMPLKKPQKVSDLPPEIEASRNIQIGNHRAATNEDREEVKQKAKAGERKESKFVKYGKAAGWTMLDMMTASLGITSQKTGKLITASLIRDFIKAGKEDKAELKPVFDFLENQKPPFKRVGREDGYDSKGNPMSTWVFRGGNPETNITVNRETIGASNPDSKEFFLKCVGEFAKAKNRVENPGKPGEKINLNISGDKEAVEGLKKEIESKDLKKFKDMPGIKQTETKPQETQVPTPPPQQQQITTAPSPHR